MGTLEINMFRELFIGAAIAMAPVSFAHADAKDEVAAAAKQLAEVGSYSWTMTTQGGGRGMGGGSEGTIQKDGLTRLILPARDAEIEVLLKGERAAFNSPDAGWTAVADPEPGQGGPGGGPERMVAGMVRSFRPPADLALRLAESVDELSKADDGSYVGRLSEDEARALMQRRGGRQGPGGQRGGGRDGAPRDGGGQGGPGGPGGFGGAEILDPAATVAFWVSDGFLTKFQYHVTGRMSFNGEEREIDRETTVEIRDIGSAKIDVPDEARQALAD